MKKELLDIGVDFVHNSMKNYIDEKTALAENLSGLQIYEEPVFAFGDALDPKFAEQKNAKAVGECFITPEEWLPGAKSVISFFLPFTERVRRSNTADMHNPSQEWLHARIEGQEALIMLCKIVQSRLQKSGFEAVIPSADPRFCSVTSAGSSPKFENKKLSFTSNWSERHAAYICGLGTFCLSKGLITKKGVSGRFGSIITNAEFAPDQREYKALYEYCTFCGACIKNCPAGAISLENGKDHLKCSAFLELTKEKYAPRYGCGKCQVNVPCESGKP